MAESLLKVYKDCISKVLHPSLNALIYSVLVGPRVHQAAEPIAWEPKILPVSAIFF